MGVKNLGYVIMHMAEPQQWIDFGVNILGLSQADRDDKAGAKFLRMDEAPFRFMIEPADADQFYANGYDAGDEGNFAALIAAVKATGADVTEGSAEEAKRRCVTKFVTFSDPADNRIELYYGRTDESAFKAGPLVSKFITGDMGLGHTVMPAPNFDEVSAFYRDVLGFGLSDDLTLPPFMEGVPDQHLHFMHCDNPRHHTLALYNFPNPAGMVHVMVEVATVDEVGLGLDRAKAAGVPVIASIGRHAYENDHMFSFYMMGPGGFAVEYGCDGKQVDDWSQYEPTVTTSGDLWGHEYNFPDAGDA